MSFCARFECWYLVIVSWRVHVRRNVVLPLLSSLVFGLSPYSPTMPYTWVNISFYFSFSSHWGQLHTGNNLLLKERKTQKLPPFKHWREKYEDALKEMNVFWRQNDKVLVSLASYFFLWGSTDFSSPDTPSVLSHYGKILYFSEKMQRFQMPSAAFFKFRMLLTQNQVAPRKSVIVSIRVPQFLLIIYRRQSSYTSLFASHF